MTDVIPSEKPAASASHEESQDIEEGRDTVSEIPTTAFPHARHVTNYVSDITGLVTASNFQAAARQRKSYNRKTVSDMVLMMNLSEDAVRAVRRQKSSSDVITKFNQAPILRNADLRMAEMIIEHGTRRQRQESGLSEIEIRSQVDEKEAYEAPDDFEFNDQGLSSGEAAELLQKYGRNELVEKTVPRWLVFLRLFWAPMPLMLWLAIIIEAAISNFLDMGILLFIQFTNASISFYESSKAGNAIAALKSSLKPMATCKRDGKFVEMDATLLVPGDTVLLASGSAVPADCRVNFSEIDVDQAALTGESLPVTMYKGDSVKMGSTVVRGEVEATGMVHWHGD